MDDIEQHALENNKTLVDGIEVDPWSIRIDPVGGDVNLDIELNLSIMALLHELQESDVKIDRNGLANFVLEDIEKHKDVAMQAYLNLVNPKPIKGFWDRFRKRPDDVKTETLWCKTTNVALKHDGILCIYGRGCPLG